MYEYKAKLLRVIDGDTVDLFVDLGFETWKRERVRLIGIDTPERGQPGFDEATAHVIQWFSERGNKCILRSFVDREKRDKYGRYLGGISSLDNEAEVSLNEEMLDLGFAKEYK